MSIFATPRAAVRPAVRSCVRSITGAGGGLDPLNVDGLIAAYDFGDQSTLFSDAGVTPASEGDPVYRVTDAGGGTLYLDQSTVSSQWIREGDIVTPPATPDGYPVSGTGIPFDWRAGSVIVVLAKRRESDQQFMSAGILQDANYLLWGRANALESKSSAETTVPIPLIEDDLGFLGAAFGSSDIHYTSNLNSTTDATPATASGSLNYDRIFRRTTSGFPLNTPVRAIYFYDRQLSIKEMESVRDYFGIIQRSTHIRAVGDSITGGSTVTDIADSFMGRLASLGNWSISNGGVSSSTASYLASSNGTRGTNGGLVDGITNVLHILIGVNDAKSGGTLVGDIYADILTSVSSAKASFPGLHVIVGTLISRAESGATWDPAFASMALALDGLNTLIKDGAVANGYTVADYGADSDLGPLGGGGAGNANTAPNTWFADGTHPNETGHGIMSAITADAIGSVI